MYKVINRFQEKNHDNHVYEIGDTYPANGKKLNKTRAEFLTKVHAEYGVAFLKPIDEPKKANNNQSTKEPSADKEVTE